MYTTVVIVERRLSDADVEALIELHGEEGDRFFVLVPGDGGSGGLLRTLDDLALGELRQAATDIEDDVRAARRGHHPDGNAEALSAAAAAAALASSVASLRERGADADGALAAGDPLQALTETTRRVEADEVIVMTRPHLVEEFFHRDWASRARRATGLPVLKLIAHQE